MVFDRTRNAILITQDVTLFLTQALLRAGECNLTVIPVNRFLAGLLEIGFRSIGLVADSNDRTGQSSLAQVTLPLDHAKHALLLWLTSVFLDARFKTISVDIRKILG